MTLYQAAKEGDLETVRALLASGADMNEIKKGSKNVFGISENSGTALKAAAEAGHTEIVRALIAAGADVRLKDANGAGPLMHAVAPGHAEIVTLLLKAGAKPDEKESNGRTALSIAAWAGHEAIAQSLIQHGADVQSRDSSKVTPLHYAVRQRKAAIARMLLQAGAPVNAKDSSGNTPLHDAAQQLFLVPDVDESVESPIHLELIELLLASGADVDALDDYECTPLERAIYDSRVETARRLISAGANVNKPKGKGSLLMSASDDLAMTKILIAAGADVNADDRDGETALFGAVRNENEGVIRALVAAGADVHHRTHKKKGILDEPSQDGNTELFDLLVSLGATDASGKHTSARNMAALLKAAEEGDTLRVNELLAHGTPVDEREKYGGSALWKAAKGGHVDCVRLLLSTGANPNLPGNYESRPLHMAAAVGSAECVEALLAAGADPNVTYEREWGEGYKGWTPLMEAAEGCDLEIVRLLVESGANLTAEAKNGYTALICAAQAGSKEVVDYLLTAGAPATGVSEHFVEAVNLPARLSEVAVEPVIAEAAAALGVPPTFHEEAPGLAVYDITVSSDYAVRKEAHTVKIVERLLKKEQCDTEEQARAVADFGAGSEASDETINALLARHQEAFLAKGCSLVCLCGFGGDRIALLPTINPYAVIARLGPGPSGIPKMIEWLQKLEKKYPFRLHGCGGATLMLRFTGKIGDPEALAKTLVKLGSDEVGVVSKGNHKLTDSVKKTAKALEQPEPIVRLWWD